MKIENWKIWRNMSRDGKVCGILNCDATPKNKCPICNNHYCLEHIKIHYHQVGEKITL